ncbi:MAG: hypothetical protein V4542_20590 [Pseudomonadota bacterium]
MRHVVFAFVLLSANLAVAQLSTPQPGEYVTDGGSSSLTIDSASKFDINTQGANGHLCSLEGVIINGKSKIDNSACQVTLKAQGPHVMVTTNGSEECRDFCGARAWFEGLYRRPSPLCTRQSIESSKKIFKKEYSAKNFSAALAAIGPIATDCKQLLHWFESAWISNDLALTQFKLGDRAACLRTLKPLAAEAAMTNEEIKSNYPPIDGDMYLPVVAATRTNLKLCTKK